MSVDTPWISVGELAHGFQPGSFSPQPSADLAGRTYNLHLEDGRTLQYRFANDRSLAWTVTAGPGAGRTSTGDYLALLLREDLYLVDFLDTEERATSVTLVLDLARSICTLLTGRLPDEAEAGRSLISRLDSGLDLTGVEVTFLSGAVDREFNEDSERHPHTDELVGKRVEYTYSPSERYEHIYLNERFYTWHCLLGVERGLADTDRCHYRKLGEKLYLFVWREKLVPTLGVVVLDYTDMTSRGKIFGYQGTDFSTLVNFTVGSKARLVNVAERLEAVPGPRDAGDAC